MSSLDQLSVSVRDAAMNRTPVNIVGGGSRSFLGNPPGPGHLQLDMSDHCGVLDYHPEELVIRAKAGTCLVELIQLLNDQGQMLPFEPPVHGDTSTVGGLVATGLSGSRRPHAGAVKDAVLGVGLILQDGSYAEFGGQVMKNVAGYDVSRLVCGSFGMLGPIADVSLKVLPRPEAEQSIALEMPLEEARAMTRNLLQRVSGLSASCYLNDALLLRFSGNAANVERECRALGGKPLEDDFWSRLDSQSLPVFSEVNDLWRLSTSPDEPLDADQFMLVDWGFGQRWLADPQEDPRKDYQGKGHWTRYNRSPDNFEAAAFQPLSNLELQLNRRLKSAFDTHGIFNPGRMYDEL